MADTKSVYLPPLEACLTGEALLLSWRNVYEALSRDAARVSKEPWSKAERLKEETPFIEWNDGLLSFFADNTARRLLKNPFDPFSSPSTQTRAAYDTRTSAINVTASSQSKSYDVDKIKEDALWLSVEAKLDESVALRAVILEWQSRAGTLLLQTETRHDAHEHNDLGFGASLRSSFLGESIQQKSSLFTPDAKDQNTYTEAARKSRLLSLVLEERLYILRTTELLVHLHIAQHSNELFSRELGIYGLSNDVVQAIFGRKLQSSQGENFLQLFVDALKKRIHRLESGSGWTNIQGSHEIIESRWNESQVEEIISILKMWCSVLDRVYASASSTISFFNFMRDSMMMDFQVPLVSVFSLEVMKILTSIVATKYLARVTNSLQAQKSIDPPEFWSSEDAMQEINTIMIDLVSGSNPLAGIPVYAWVLFVHSRLQYISPQSPSDGPVLYHDDSNLQQLAHTAIDGMHLFDIISAVADSLPKIFRGEYEAEIQDNIRISFLSMLSYSKEHHIVQYGAEIMRSLLSLLDANRSYWANSNHRILFSRYPEQIVRDFLNPWLESAQWAFPLESAPLIHLLKAFLMTGNDSSQTYYAFCMLFNNEVDTFTDRLSLEFEAYEEADVEMSPAYFIELQQDLPLFIARFRAAYPNGIAQGTLARTSRDSWESTSVISTGIKGQVLNQQRPLEVRWNHKYNPLDYLIDSLATAAPGSQQIPFSTMTPPSNDDCADIISLCTTILQSLQEHTSSEEEVSSLLDTRPRGFEDDKDLISIVFEIFEYQLQQHRGQSSSGASIELLTRCVEFIHAITYHRPGRIWPLLARSQLLDISGSDPSLVAIVFNSEIVQGDYVFLHSCVKLFERLVDLSLAHEAVVSQPPKSVSLTKLGQEANGSRARYIPGKNLKSIMISYLRIMVSVFENSQLWQFSSSSQRISINVSLVTAFNKVLRSTYGFFQPEELQSKNSNVLADCALKLTDLCLTTGSSDGLVAPLVSILCSPLPDFKSSLDLTEAEVCLEKSRVMDFCSTILRVAIYTQHDGSLLEQRLFDTAPQLAKFYASTMNIQSTTARLMDVLLIAALRHGTAPPSLLGHMGAVTAKGFLTLLTRFGQACTSQEQQLSTWKLLTTVVSGQQQWFALYLLTGKAPRELASNSDTHAFGCLGQAVFKYALDQATITLDVIPTAQDKNLQVVQAILDFIAQSFNHWPWAATALRQHPKFITTVVDYFGKLNTFDNASGDFMWHTTIGASIAEILTMHLHMARQSGDVQPALSLVNKLGFIKNYAFKPPSYKWSAHKMLRANIAGLYSSLDISRFQHTLAFPTEYGANFFYDTPSALTMIKAVKSSDKKESKRKTHDSFEKDITFTNSDLSQIDARMKLHKKSKMLVIELAHALPKDGNLVLMDPLLDILNDVLQYMDTKSKLPTAVLESLSCSQVDLAFILLQKLVSLKNTTKLKDVVDQFPLIWQSVSDMIPAFEALYTGDHAEINRKLLGILFLGIQPLTQWRGNQPDLAASARATVVNRLASTTYNKLLEIVSEVIAKGFKSLSILIHENTSATSPSDFGLLTAMLQTILTIPGLETIHSTMVLQFQNAEVSRYATSLFSWSDQLLVDGDPVYGEHSILFLLELSSIPAMAEILAVDGVLSQLSSANLMALYSRPRGFGPFDNPPRVHSIWARGILPLCLNLLSSVGGPIAAEVVAFLLQSSPQIARVARDLDNTNSPVGVRPGDTHMTLTIAAEVHTLSLISVAIERIRSSGGAADMPPSLASETWDLKSVKEDVEEWLSLSTVRRNLIVPVSERDADLASMIPEDPNSTCESRLEERVWAELRGAKECLSGDVGVLD